METNLIRQVDMGKAHGIPRSPRALKKLVIQIPLRISWGLLACVFSVPPGKANAQLREAGVKRLRTSDRPACRFGYQYLADNTLVAVPLFPFHINIFAEHELRQGFLRPLAERLCLFGGINARDPDFVLFAIGVQYGDRVAVRHAHHASTQCLGAGGNARH